MKSGTQINRYFPGSLLALCGGVPSDNHLYPNCDNLQNTIINLLIFSN